MRPDALLMHGRQKPRGQVMPTEDIGFELGAQNIGWQVLDEAGLAIGAVVEQGIELAVREGKNVICARCNAGWIGVVKLDGLQPFAGEHVEVGRLARGGNDPPATALHADGAGITDAGRASGDEDGAGHLDKPIPSSPAPAGVAQ
jgi:hypothetical protein